MSIKQRAAKIPWFRIIRSLIPVLKAAAEGIIAAKSVDSDGGKKITRVEWENILHEILMEAVPHLASEMDKEEI